MEAARHRLHSNCATAGAKVSGTLTDRTNRRSELVARGSSRPKKGLGHLHERGGQLFSGTTYLDVAEAVMSKTQEVALVCLDREENSLASLALSRHRPDGRKKARELPKPCCAPSPSEKRDPEPNLPALGAVSTDSGSATTMRWCCMGQVTHGGGSSRSKR